MQEVIDVVVNPNALRALTSGANPVGSDACGGHHDAGYHHERGKRAKSPAGNWTPDEGGRRCGEVDFEPVTLSPGRSSNTSVRTKAPDIRASVPPRPPGLGAMSRAHREI
jgi:hypothetical protein